MISQFYQKSKGKVMMAVVAFLCLTSYSCKNTQDSIVSDDTVVKVNLLGVATPASSNAPKTKAGGAANQDEQVTFVPFAKGSNLIATLTADAPTSKASGLRASTNRAAAGTDIFTLAAGVKYAVLVYDSNGDLKSEQVYSTEDLSTEIALNAGVYTFRAYSINETSVPTVDQKDKLSTASLKDISADLMYFEGTLTVNAGQVNNIDVILKHQYSQIITKIKMNSKATGNITEIGSSVITPTRIDASLRFSDHVITYNNSENTAGANVLFPALGAQEREVISVPTLLINPTAANGKLTIAKLTIAGETRENLLIEGLNIVPGQRYTLILNYEVCTQDVFAAGGMDWTYTQTGNTGATLPEGTWVLPTDGSADYQVTTATAVLNGTIAARKIVAPATDYGFVFEIYTLDNSFNMLVNNVKISDDELQFQAGTEGGTAQNIEFDEEAVGVSYGTNSIDQVWTTALSGDYVGKTNPLIKVLIAADGTVTLLGRKTKTGELLPLRLKGGKSFNKVNWDGTTTNDVTISQRVMNTTSIKAYGYGTKRVACN